MALRDERSPLGSTFQACFELKSQINKRYRIAINEVNDEI